MEGTTLRWKATTAALPGFLLTALLLSGTSALMCERSTSTLHYKSQQRLTTGSSNVTCSADEKTCVTMKGEFRIDGIFAFVNLRDCVLKNTTGSVSGINFDGNNRTFHYNLSYCLHDLCNAEMTRENTPKIPEVGKAPEESGSLECYAGVNFESSEPFLERVKCGKDDIQCYQTKGMISMGHVSVPMYIRSCQGSHCTLRKEIFSDTLNYTTYEGSCCTGSFCNVRGVGSQLQPNSASCSLLVALGMAIHVIATHLTADLR